MESYPEQYIYTRESKSGRSKAKLDHILLNKAMYDLVEETGWIQTNPIIHSDHGLIWMSISKDKLNIPNQPKSNNKDKHLRTRLKGANLTTHTKYAGHPVRLLLNKEQNTETSKSRLSTSHIAELLIQNGYHHSFFTHHTKCLQQANETIESLFSHGNHKDLIQDTISKSIKWRNDKKEWWIHTKYDWVANHILTKGKPLYGLDYRIQNMHGKQDNEPDVWEIKYTGPKITSKNMLKILTTKLFIPKEHIKECRIRFALRRKQTGSATATAGTAGQLEETETTSRDQVWRIRLADNILRNLWSSVLDPWCSDDTQHIVLKDHEPNFKYATGWKSYEDRLDEVLLHPQQHAKGLLNAKEIQVLGNYRCEHNGTFKTTGYANNSALDLWNIIKKLMQECASKSFGHYSNHNPNPRTTLTSMIYKWITALNTLCHHVKLQQHSFLLNEPSDAILQIKTVTTNIPINSVQPSPHVTIQEWLLTTKEIISTLKQSYVTLRSSEIKENEKHTKRNLDAWFIYDVDKYLNHTIRIPQSHQGGLDWPTDSQGNIPLDPSSRIQHHKTTWEAKTDTRKNPPNLQQKLWLQQLMRTSNKLTPQQAQEITQEITLSELQDAYHRIKPQSAPGPTGIRNAQWKNSPPNMQVLILDLFNNIYETGAIPEEMKNGTIYPIPKDPTKTCTSQNARPLTMLETGLKIMTQILSNRITKTLTYTPMYTPTQYAFLPGKTILDPLRLIEHAQADARLNNKEIHQTFLDLTQAFDRLEFWAGEMALKRMNYPDKFNKLIHNLNVDSRRRIVTKDGNTTDWKLQCGIAQGEVLSPIRFITVMDMLATWLAMRANGCNPSKKNTGYTIKPKKSTRVTQTTQIPTHKLNAILYCDDISITTDNFDDMQDQVGIISEFMTTFGIQINNNKSFYTMKSHKPIHQQQKITNSPSITGTWEGGMDGNWIPSTKPLGPHTEQPKYLTVKQVDEPIRYLGVHFTLNGDWKYQHKILKDSLNKCLMQIRRRNLPQDQLAYLINVVILPKLTYPLNVINILTGNIGTTITTDLDKMITRFVTAYFGLPKCTNRDYFYTSKAFFGFDLNSVEDEVNINTITNTTISLNEIDEYWTLSTNVSTEVPSTNCHDARLLREACHHESHLFPKLLRSTLHQHDTFCLHGYQKGNQNQDDLPGNLTSRFTKLGYTIHPAVLTTNGTALQNQNTNPTTHFPHLLEPNTDIIEQTGTHLVRLLTSQTYHKIVHKLILHNTFCMNDFTTPSGTHLLTWKEFIRWEQPTRKAVPNKQTWFTALESETQEPNHLDQPQNNNQTQASTRGLRTQFIDIPKDIEFDQPFCYYQNGTLHICNPIQQSLDALKVTTSTLTREDTFWHNRDYTPKIELILLHSRKFSKDKGALIPLDGILTSAQIESPETTIMDAHTHHILSLQCKKTTRIHTIYETLCSDTSGSILTETDVSRGHQDAYPDPQEPHQDHPHKQMIADSYSDGSVYHHHIHTSAGYATVKIDPETKLDDYKPIVLRRNHPQYTRWTSPSSTMNHSPDVSSSTEVELLGLQISMDWFSHDTPYTHALDNKAVLQTIATPTPPRHIRHYLRENSHYTLSYIRQQLKNLNYYTNQDNKSLINIQWIKGHSGNRLHECADRNAARIAFRRTTIREPHPNVPMQHANQLDIESKTYPLYFYECLVSNDIRKHAKTVCKEIHKKEWSRKKSQGKILRLITSEGTAKYSNPTFTITNLPDAQRQRFFSKMLNSISHTPHQSHKIKQLPTPECTICKHKDADTDHILYHCQHKQLNHIRQQLQKAIIDLLTPKNNLITYSQSLIPERDNMLCTPNHILYPHSIDLHDEPPTRILEALPESRWYRKSKTNPDTITIENPTHRKSDDIDHPKHFRVAVLTFWNLITWHDLTHDTPRPLSTYDNRAIDIWQAIKEAKETSGHQSLCWATNRSLLDILIDEIGCQRELFSNILNTYHRFTSRCMLQPNPTFATKAKIILDGLSQQAFEGNVYGNPPYDGSTTRNNTVNKTLDMAEQTCMRPKPFRGTFILPLSADKLRKRLASPHATLLFRFPNNTLPFIPDGFWQGKQRQFIGCYNQANTNVVLLLYQTEMAPTGHPEINIELVRDKLAQWFLAETPTNNQNATVLTDTGVPIKHFQKAWTSPYPAEWKFWKPIPDYLHDTLDRKYPGAAMDANFGPENPFKDIITWDRRASALGIFPKSFALFVKNVAKSKKTTNQIIRSVSYVMRTYSYRLFKKYWHLQRNLQGTETLASQSQETPDQEPLYLRYQTDSDDGISV